MGGNLSQEKESSSHQTQLPSTPPRPQTTRTTSNNNPTIHNINNHNINNNGNSDNAKLRKMSSFQNSQPPIMNIPIPKNVEATNNDRKGKQAEKVVGNRLPHNYEAIIRESDSPINTSSPEKLHEHLYAGVYLNGRKKKYWVEKKGHINCFMVLAPSLSITWSGDDRYWQWHNVETSEGKTNIAVLKNVCWLEVHGRLHTSNLTPGVTYQVAYIVKFEYTSYGWEVPVNLRLTLPNGTRQERKENLSENKRDEWVRIPVGEFKVGQDSNNVGEIEFSLYEYEGGNWKSGLVIKGVVIEPKVV